MSSNGSSSLSANVDDQHRPISAFELLNANRSLKQISRMINRVALSDIPVLITGESGTGKELVAKAIHEQGGRASKPMVCLNLAAVPIELAETVMFGHEKGAFTGAYHASPGYCRKADGGTLFLDEVGEADWSLQSKLLRFLQSREIQPVGSQSVITVDVRIIAATNRHLELAVREKRFREDLFYRLSVVQIHLPPLRERTEDTNALLDYFLDEFNSKYSRHCNFSTALRDRFKEAYWPGNLRQLRAVVESLVLLSDNEILGIQDLSPILNCQIGRRSSSHDLPPELVTMPILERMTHDLINSVLQQTNGHVAAAAEKLGISRSTLYRWIKRYGNSSDMSSARPAERTPLWDKHDGP